MKKQKIDLATDFEVQRMQTVLPDLLTRATYRYNSRTTLRPRYVLLINGHLPYQERLRSSPKACRSALIRLIRDAMYYVEPFRQLTYTQRPVYNKKIKYIVDQLEQAGIVQYAPIGIQSTNTNVATTAVYA